MNSLACVIAALNLCAISPPPVSSPPAQADATATLGQVPASSSALTLLMEIDIYQFKAPPAGAAAEAPARGDDASAPPEVADPADGAAAIHVLGADDLVRVFGKPTRLDAPELEASRISAPRLLCYSGQPASVMIGRELEYLEPAGEKLFRAMSGPDVFEGLKVDVTAAIKDGVVRVERFQVRLSECIDRMKLDGLDLPVGKPRMRTCEVSTQFNIEPDQRGLIPIRTQGQQDPAEYLLVAIRIKPGGAPPAAKPAK